MTTRRLLPVLAITITALTFCGPRADARGKPGGGDGDPAPYLLVDLLGVPRPEGGYHSEAVSLSEPDGSGGVCVVGYTDLSGSLDSRHPALWEVSATGAFDENSIAIGLPEGTYRAHATGVNDWGIVVWDAVSPIRTSWVDVPGLTPQLLPIVGDESRTSDINNVGEMVGMAAIYDPWTSQGALWRLGSDAEGNVAPGLPVPLGRFFPHAISDNGIMAGVWYLDENLTQAQAAIGMLDESDSLHVMPIGPAATDSFESEATAISQNGAWVAGRYREADGPGRAFAWNTDQGFISLGALDPDGGSTAFGVNDKGQVVGSTGTGKRGPSVFLWQENVMTDLNAIVDTGRKTKLFRVNAINNAGHIIGQLSISSGVSSEYHACVLIPVEN